MLGGADKSNGDLRTYITGADILPGISFSDNPGLLFLLQSIAPSFYLTCV